MNIIDVLIEERAERLLRHPRLWRLIKRFVYPVLDYDEAVRLVDQVADWTGAEIFELLSQRLRLELDVTGLEHVPSTGLAVITPNHPAGIADGIAVYDAIKQVRSDIVFFANRDAVRAAPRMTDMIVPVEWMEHRRSHQRNKETVRHLVEAFRSDKLIVLFPSGRLARPTLTGLVEREWLPTAVGLAQKYRTPLIPMNIRAHNSLIYYLFYTLHTELRDMTLFRELLNKEGRRYRISIGEPFLPTADPVLLTPRLRHFVCHDLPRGLTRFDDQPREHPGDGGSRPGTVIR